MSNDNLSSAAEVRDWAIQAFMENAKELDIVQIVQSLSNRFL
jgi:hypothetical protein